MQNVTTFDPSQKYILLSIVVTNVAGEPYKVDALLDTGAPTTEFSDDTLEYLGFLEKKRDNVHVQEGLQTQKYGRVVIPKIDICSHAIENLDVYVSHFEKSWGIKALIGLDFFRTFRVTIDYNKGLILSEPYQ